MNADMGARTRFATVMPGLAPGIHVFLAAKQNVDGRNEPGDDEIESIRS